ncbi:galactose-1-phosphate uridylyltransferase [Jimgerdemannia flammicorona]|uniref:Galactose-1-phosphate uridylyltransferase n=2 Tax=Jimgerdemannia flammicorona TaxID=994334 RepID=A0A433D8G7_9FUNG|nr:galactose-1-phosphate uridylyltransferase [Jimgerdemannia flammicorona]RUS25201.1 galactose-1-phosphate uridylyltransferase [Jimgerdemannia flammicorona]
MFQFTHHSHRRYNPLTNSWVLCSPHRTQRPWQGQQESQNIAQLPEYDPKCYLCPGNARASGDMNRDYESTFTFPNDYPAVKVDQPEYKGDESMNGLLRVQGVRGQCHVVCFSPAHNMTIAEMPEDAIVPVVRTWIKAYTDLAQVPYVNYVQIFENKGAIMGCSNPHPHGQIWCTESIPEEPSKEIHSMRQYYADKGTCLLCDYAKLESTSEGQPRVVCENPSFVCVVPFWGVWPFETMILSKRHVTKLPDLTEREQRDLANIIRRIACRYDNLFETSFPYSMGVHHAPVDGGDHEHDTHLHLHFYPPLLRGATVKKFLVGFEMLGEPQRDLTPEQAAERLRNCSEIHYKNQQV